MQTFDLDATTVATFKNMPKQNNARTLKEGRPIFDDVEVVEMRQAGDRQSVKTFPAHEIWRVDEESGENVTYAMRFSEQYKRFKSGKQQVMDGTPLDEAPFLTDARRSELKALSVFTVESLAALEGQNLKNIGQGGRELKAQAQAYIDNASGSANSTRLAQENEWLKEQLAAMQAQQANLAPVPTLHETPVPSIAPETATDKDFDGMDASALKDWIEAKTGKRPLGNPNRETLVATAEDIAKGA